MSSEKQPTLRVDFRACTGCRACTIVCALSHEQQHYLTFGDAGRDNEHWDQDNRRCEAGGRNHDVDEQCWGDVDPNYQPVFDMPGKRFRTQGSSIFTLTVKGVVTF